jgi:predicted metal-dependent phosphoesterase TrpH
MVVADLHVHTTNSDGTLTVADLPRVATEAELQAVAVTDHDRLHDLIDAPLVERDGVTIVRGIELRVETNEFRVDLLGYAVDPTPALERELRRIQRDRIERGRAIIDAVESRLDVELAVDVSPGIGRPHIAQAIADHPETGYDVDEAFQELIGTGCPCYVPREVPSFDRGRRLLADACPVVGLAHPFRYPDLKAALELTASLDAVERYYPYDRPVDQTPVDEVIEQHGLLVTGGSDAHDERLGRAGLERPEFERFRRALTE